METKFDIFKKLIPENQVTELESVTSEQFCQCIKTLKSHYNKFRKTPAKLKTFIHEKFQFSQIGTYKNWKTAELIPRKSKLVCERVKLYGAKK